MPDPQSSREPIDVLLAEDAETEIDLVRTIMANRDGRCRLTVVRDGDEMMAYLRRQGAHRSAVRPDLILLDLDLPKTDWRDVLQQVKGDSELCVIPVIALSASEDERDVIDAYSRHANGFVLKARQADAFADSIRTMARFWTSVAILPPK